MENFSNLELKYLFEYTFSKIFRWFILPNFFDRSSRSKSYFSNATLCSRKLSSSTFRVSRKKLKMHKNVQKFRLYEFFNGHRIFKNTNEMVDVAIRWCDEEIVKFLKLNENKEESERINEKWEVRREIWRWRCVRVDMKQSRGPVKLIAKLQRRDTGHCHRWLATRNALLFFPAGLKFLNSVGGLWRESRLLSN